MEEGNIPETQFAAIDPERFPALDLLPAPMLWRMRNLQTPEVQDLLRKKWIVLTPEEWVRQHVLHWLLTRTGFPPSLLSVERGIKQQVFRSDVVGYDRQGKPLLLVECKEARIRLSEETLFQAMKYNQELKARFLWITNGISHKVLEVDGAGMIIRQHPQLPVFEDFLRVIGDARQSG